MDGRSETAYPIGVTESDYTVMTSALLKRILKACDQIDPDILEADGNNDMVTITAKSGEKVIVNTQRAVMQMWVAGSGQGIHFSHENGRWLDDKNKGLELMAWISTCVESMAQLKLDFH
jgi:CyaY protein